MQLYQKFGNQDIPSPEAIQEMREYYRKHKDLSDSIKQIVRPFRPSNPIHYEDQAELFPGNHPRTEGKKLTDMDAAAAEQSFCSFDVIQQSPEALDIPVDQQHVVNEWKPSASNKMPDARWKTLITEEEVRAREELYVEKNHGVTQIYKFVDEDVSFALERKDTVATDARGVVNGINGVRTATALNQAKKNAKKFRRIGTFDQMIQPSRGDKLTPKVDGEALYIACRNGEGIAVDRLGNTWSFAGANTFRILVECVPSVNAPEQIFLTHAWRWNIVNNIGVMFNKRMLQKKKISFDLGNGPLQLEFPSFENVPKSDGLVLHKGRGQFFFKEVPTVDVFERATKNKLEETLGDKLVADWKDGHGEYAVVWHKDVLHLKWLKNRSDKLHENGYLNILEVCNAPPFESWVETFEDMELERL